MDELISRIFRDYIKKIEEGKIEYEGLVLDLIKDYKGLDVSKLESALNKGRKIVFQEYIKEIGKGNNRYIIKAARLVQDFNFPLSDLENALKAGQIVSLNDKKRMKQLIDYNQVIIGKEILEGLKAVLSNSKDIPNTYTVRTFEKYPLD